MIRILKLPFKAGGYTANDVIIFVGRELGLSFAEAKSKISLQSDITPDKFSGEDMLIGKFDGEIASFVVGRGPFATLHSRFGFKAGMAVAVTFPDPSTRKKLRSKVDDNPTYQSIMARLQKQRETDEALA